MSEKTHEIGGISPDTAFNDVGSTFYARIMSDERMIEFRERRLKMRNAMRGISWR